jgi:hypothetical protein
MEDAVGIIISIILFSFIITGVTVTHTTSTEEKMVQEYVDLKTTQFVDSVRSNGYMSQQMYMTYIQDLLRTGNVYELKMTKEHASYVPIYDDNGNFTNDYQENMQKSYEKEIIDQVMSDEDYTFSKNDYFYVEVYSKNITKNSRVMESILNIFPQNKTIHTYYGGAIRNERI